MLSYYAVPRRSDMYAYSRPGRELSLFSIEHAYTVLLRALSLRVMQD